MSERQTKLLPFHESVVSVIKTATPSTLYSLEELLKITKVPKDHDKIIDAWRNRLRELDLQGSFGVEQNLLMQKREAEEKSEATRQATENRIQNIHLDQ